MTDNPRQGLISRFLSWTGDAENAGSPVEPGVQLNAWADNASRTVQELLVPLLRQPPCLIVTGYQDFLSSLSILLNAVPNLLDQPAGSYRIVFGSNTETRKTLGGEGRSVDEEARHYYLGSRGLSVSDLADLRAVLAVEAIERGIIQFRVFDQDLAREQIGRRPTMLHAKLFVGPKAALSGSANFSQGGLRRNLEFIDDVSDRSDLAIARRTAAENYWGMGRDWTDAALEILHALLRLVSPEEAVARTVIEATSFTPWCVAGDTSTGRPPQPFQAELVYEAAGTIYEHGFAFVEAPTGAGKTDIGKHLATVLPVSHGQTVFSWGERADQQRLGSLALIPASVLKNWTTNAPANFKPIKHSHLSRKSEEAELDEVNRNVRSSAALIVDESHRLSSRYLAPSARSLVFERSPAIWTACLSATLMGNQGLDGLLAFHEKRASIYVPPPITDQINNHMQRVRERGTLHNQRNQLTERIEAQALQEDLFDDAASLQQQLDQIESELEARDLNLRSLQEGLATVLSPYVVRRQRACIGESRERSKTSFVYPTVKSHRRDTELDAQQARVIHRIKVLAEAITTGVTLVSADPKRAGQTEIRFHDKSRIHIRNFLAILRASVTFSREEWAREREVGADQRGRASIGESLRRAERQNARGILLPDGELQEERPIQAEESDTPICDRISALLNHPCLDAIDEGRADAMRAILRKHPHAIFLAERVGVLEVYARLLAGQRGRGPEVYVVAPGAKLRTGKKLHHLRSGAEAQEVFGIDGRKVEPFKQRAMFMTFQMAEGINLQQASALGIIGVTSDIKSLIQGLGRIDRIDSPHPVIHYFTFDLPGVVLSSDYKARERVAGIALLSGVGATDLATEIEEFAAGDLTDLVLDQVKKPRVLRTGNYFDQVENLRRGIPPEVMQRVRTAAPRGLWGAELCVLSSTEPASILLLGKRTGGPSDPSVLPPRLLAIRQSAEGSEIIGEQSEVARLLVAAYSETRRRGLHQDRPSITSISKTLDHLSGTLAHLKHWDIRPARTVSLLSSLADFLSESPSNDQGQECFGNLILPAIEKLAETWAHELDVFWIAAKEAVSQRSAAGVEIPDYLGINAIYERFQAQPMEVQAAVRGRMGSLLERCKELSAGQAIDVLGRVSVIFDART
ncbi:hypothetical protein [Oceanicola sp. 502str15]|uniref:hypothetical protein n=1 Tax=Oceanicola sp. 502str15 TaxID=2696061 RepID=UPI0020948469|nr:hypothetical protein [Oceanicola sp. 502str15]